MKNDLVSALERLVPRAESDAFACKLQLPAKALKITVEPVGNIRLPVSKTRARALIRHARQAPFGLGENTLLDTSIRNVWEIAKSRVKIDNRHWNQSLKPALEEIRLALELPEGVLAAKLDKLLIYEPGQFFVPHQDSERSDDMMATLVVVLPSDHKGGSLIVSHKGNKKRFSIRNPDADKLTLFSFYSDCTHEVKPVADGYRVALSYNLSFTPARQKRAAKTVLNTTELRQALNALFADSTNTDITKNRESPEKLVYLFDHQYTQRSLSWDRFKGPDKARADALKAAATELDMHVNLCLVDVNELWSAYDKDEPGYDGFYNSYRGYYGYDEDCDDDEVSNSDAREPGSASNAGSEYELQELIEGSMVLTHWVTDNKVRYPSLHVDERELCWTRATDEFTPVSEEHEGYMGNYGNTLDRQYQRAAVVIWPKSVHLRILFRMDEGLGMRELSSLARADASAAKQHAMAVFDTVWPDTAQLNSAASLSATIKLLVLLNDSSLSKRALAAYEIEAVNNAQMRPLINLGTTHGKGFCEQLIAGWIKPQGTRYRYVSLGWIEKLPRFCELTNEHGGPAWKRATERLWHFYYEKLAEQHAFDSQNDRPSERIASSSTQVAQLVAMYRSAQHLPNAKAVTKLLQYLNKNRQVYLDETLVSFLESLSKLEHDAPRIPALRTLARLLVDTLSSQLTKPPRASDDWRMSVVLDCNCADCRSLGKYLASPEQRCDLPLAKKRRMHLHRVIDGAELPVSHTTLREGSPQVLQLVKKRLLFKIDKQLRAQTAALLKKVNSLDFE